jgi:long-subunit acyl-CoA synthetase (AMP-forming)
MKKVKRIYEAREKKLAQALERKAIKKRKIAEGARKAVYNAPQKLDRWFRR